MYTTICTQPAVRPPVGYKHQGRQAILHQSDGGKQGVDRLQREAPLRMWSETHGGPDKLAKEGGNHNAFEILYEERREDRSGGLDSVHSQCSIGLEDTSEKIGSTIAEDFKKLSS